MAGHRLGALKGGGGGCLQPDGMSHRGATSPPSNASLVLWPNPYEGALLKAWSAFRSGHTAAPTTISGNSLPQHTPPNDHRSVGELFEGCMLWGSGGGTLLCSPVQSRAYACVSHGGRRGLNPGFKLKKFFGPPSAGTLGGGGSQPNPLHPPPPLLHPCQAQAHEPPAKRGLCAAASGCQPEDPLRRGPERLQQTVLANEGRGVGGAASASPPPPPPHCPP